MKLRLTTTILLAIGLVTLSALSPQAQARTWTSAADKSRTFEAKFVKCEGDVVTVRLKSGTPLSFPLSTVSAADNAFVRGRIGLKPTVVPKVKATTGLNLPALFEGKLVTVNPEGKVQPFTYAKDKVPEFFLLYVSAYW